MEKFSKRYFELINNEFKGINLTRINDYDEFYNKQILDSIAPIGASEIFTKSAKDNSIIIDVGFGGGFPILPLAKSWPEFKFIGFESRAKKVNVVSQIADMLGLSNVKLFHHRIEEVLIDQNSTITFKAVGKVFDFLSKINTNKKVQVFFYKGPGFYNLEKDQIDKTKKNWKIIEERSMDVEGTEKRLIIGFENINTTCKFEDKRFINLVKLSELI